MDGTYVLEYLDCIEIDLGYIPGGDVWSLGIIWLCLLYDSQKVRPTEALTMNGMIGNSSKVTKDLVVHRCRKDRLSTNRGFPVGITSRNKSPS